MAAVGMVWNAGQPGQVRYGCGLTGGLAASGDPLRRQAGQVGMDAADRWVAISDGGSGWEDGLRVYFPRAEAVIPDFWHAAQHISEWAKALHPTDAADATRLAGVWCHKLTHEGGAAVLAALRTMAVAGSEWQKEAHRQSLVYVGNRVHRMDDPTYRSKGGRIGSGPVEAACQPVVNRRRKGTGARWSEAVCHLRARFRSELGQWDAYRASTAA